MVKKKTVTKKKTATKKKKKYDVTLASERIITQLRQENAVLSHKLQVLTDINISSHKKLIEMINTINSLTAKKG